MSFVPLPLARASAELLLEELYNDSEPETMSALLDAVKRRMQDAVDARAAGRETWWRLREAALHALGSFADHLQEVWPVDA